MKSKFLTIIFLGMFLISLVSSLDPQLPQICGGDEELLIACLGDDELIWLSGELPEEVGGPGGEGAVHVTLPLRVPPPIEPPPIPTFLLF